MNMNRIKSFVIERAVDFITILEEDFPQTPLLTLFFTNCFPRLSLTSLIGYRNFSVLCTCRVSVSCTPLGDPQSVFRSLHLVLNWRISGKRAKAEINATEKSYLKQINAMPKILVSTFP